jgi:hypothetical protein
MPSQINSALLQTCLCGTIAEDVLEIGGSLASLTLQFTALHEWREESTEP